MLILSWQWALFGLRFWIIFNMSVFIHFTVDKHLSVRKWSRGGSVLSFLIKEHCFARKELKISAFSLKSVANLLLWNNGRITGILGLFRKIFNRAQWKQWVLVSRGRFSRWCSFQILNFSIYIILKWCYAKPKHWWYFLAVSSFWVSPISSTALTYLWFHSENVWLFGILT